MKTFQYIFLGLSVLLMVSACDKVDTPLDPSVIVIPVDSSSNAFPTVDTSAINTSFKKTLVEEFTGHKCTTCPANTRLLLQQLEDNHERMITVAYHTSGFADVTPPHYTANYKTDYGDAYFLEELEITTPIPSAIINRRVFPNFGDLKIFNNNGQFWDDPIDFENTNTSTDFGLGLAADFADSTGLFYIQASIEVLNDVDGNYNLLLMCIEDSIVSAQLDQSADPTEYPGKIVTDYVHRHMVKGSLSTSQAIAGDALIEGSATAGEWIDFKVNTPLLDNILDTHHMAVVAMIIDLETEEVVQSEEVHVHVRENP